MKKNNIQLFISILLIVYSILLLVTHTLTSEKYVRPFYTDITGEVYGYGVNTSLSAFFLGSTAVVFLLCLAFIKNESQKDEKIFYYSQIILFIYLAIDERFQVHDVDPIIRYHGDMILPMLGLLQIYLLFRYGHMLSKPKKVQLPLIIASALFVVMVFVDIVGPKISLPLRLSIEDLSKTWANAFFFLFSYNVYIEKVRSIMKKQDSNKLLVHA
ncbi:hypothetical protein [Cesiribacter andamanensis]|uniref:DUF998 domain-containing protein n=1 Tax=Cesiribacter andamanensis AMV16 TaxID=1279009 RepID=M7P004_9BACT|nr:hypothetical protein [Cesiribacter andamanensis]EMR03949.1 hypothetical protein ADICEAN_00916 [Cesiribacter andamanensis AMV16]